MSKLTGRLARAAVASLGSASPRSHTGSGTCTAMQFSPTQFLSAAGKTSIDMTGHCDTHAKNRPPKPNPNRAQTEPIVILTPETATPKPSQTEPKPSPNRANCDTHARSRSSQTEPNRAQTEPKPSQLLYSRDIRHISPGDLLYYYKLDRVTAARPDRDECPPPPL